MKRHLLGLSMVFLIWILILVGSHLSSAESRIDGPSQTKNIPGGTGSGAVQETHLYGLTFESPLIDVPQTNLPCAKGSWAMDSSNLFMCIDDQLVDGEYHWIKIKKEPF